MSEAHGTEVWIGLGVETTYGTAVARTKFLELLSESLDFKGGRQVKSVLRGITARRFVKKKTSIEGSIEAQGVAEGHELIYKHALGSVITTGPVSSQYTHFFSLAPALPVGLTMEVNRDSVAITGSSSDVYSGCQISKLTFKQSMEEALNITAEVIGKDGSFGALSTPSFVIPPGIFDWEVFTCELDSGGGYNFIDISEFELTIDNNLAADRYKLGQLARKGLGRGGHRTVTGKISKEYDSLSERNLFRNQTQGCKFRFKWTLADGRSLTIVANSIEWMGNDPKADSEGILQLSMDFQASNSIEGNEMTLTLVSLTTSVP